MGSDALRDAEVIRDLAMESVKAELVEVPGLAGVRIVKKATADVEYEIIDIEDHLTAPLRIREKVELGDPGSFIDYVERFKEDQVTTIFFDDTCSTFAAILDYAAPGEPSWGEHVATMKLRHSEEWNTWFANNKQGKGQVAFARFIEENRDDVVTPDGATLLEMVLHFEATKTATFKSSQRLKDGQIQFQYSEELKSDSVQIPDSITLSIPVFLGQKPREITLRVRYRIKEEGKLELWYEFARPQRVIQQAQDDVISMVRTGTTLPVLIGKRNPLTTK